MQSISCLQKCQLSLFYQSAFHLEIVGNVKLFRKLPYLFSTTSDILKKTQIIYWWVSIQTVTFCWWSCWKIICDVHSTFSFKKDLTELKCIMCRAVFCLPLKIHWKIIDKKSCQNSNYLFFFLLTFKIVVKINISGNL